MRAIVIGIGEVGQHIARTLSGEGQDVTVVDQDAARVEALQGDLDALVVAGNGGSPRVLQEVGAGRADLLCAVTQNDEANIIAALTAHQLGTTRTVARVRDPDYFQGNASSAHDVQGIDFVIHPERATADDLAEAILLPGAVHVEYFADGRLAVAETILTDRSPLLGQPLERRRMVRPHHVFAIISEGRTTVAEGFHRPKRGDHVLTVAAREDVETVVGHLAGRTSKARDVVIFGAGRVGLPLARRLEDAGGLRITLMERDGDRARHVAERLRRSTVLHEEGVGKDTLLAHGVDRAGAFVACAGDDRANMLASLHAKQIGANMRLAVVSREEFMPLVDAVGIDAAFSPRLVTAEAILRSVRGSSVQAMHLLTGGAEVLEVHAEPGCEAEGRTMEDITIMSRARIAAILRDGAVLFPTHGQRVRGGDRVLLFNARQGVADARRAFDAR